MKPHKPIPLTQIKEAQKRILGEVIRTPLIRLNLDTAPADIYLKLEVLQPIRAFKIRAAVNIMKLIDEKDLKNGVWTVSAGNWAQGVAWYARKLNVKCTILLPENAPQTKEDAIKSLGAHIIKISYDDMMKTFQTHHKEGMDGYFLHPFSDPAVMAGNGTIGLEILEDLPDVDSIITPWGGGGVCSGIASAIRELKPNTKLYACEVSTAAPLATSFKLGNPVSKIDYTSSFVDGMGAPLVFPEMWNLAKTLLDGSLVVELDEIADAIRILAKYNCVIAEGAGAASVAAALTGKAGDGKIVCVISGGNLDPGKFVKILQGIIPS